MRSPRALVRAYGERKGVSPLSALRNPRNPERLRSQRGFTLPELLVAMTLTLIVTGAALTALQDANRASEAGAVMTDVNQNLRVAMNIVIRDLLQTGQGIPTGGIPIPTGEGSAAVVRPSPDGSDWEFDPAWTTLPAVSPGPGIGQVINGVATDAVTLLYADPSIELNDDVNGNEVGVSVATDGSSITIDAGSPIDSVATGVQEGDLIMITFSGRGSAVQEVTGVSGQTIAFASTASSNLNQRDAPQGSILAYRNDDATWPPATAARIFMISYYLVVPTSGQITSPHFIRRVNYGDERVIAVGVENMQLTWDLVDGVTNPTNVEEPQSPNSPNQIRKANLYMAARSLEEFSRTGQYLRSSLSTQVSLRSLAFVSRYDLQ
ncbi:MAG: PilW family protein [Vicinamibacterales bacterium]